LNLTFAIATLALRKGALIGRRALNELLYGSRALSYVTYALYREKEIKQKEIKEALLAGCPES